LNTVKSDASSWAIAASAVRSTDPPQTNTTGGPEPSRSNAIVVPSFDVTVSMSPSSLVLQP
jgi:hypothetical protein